MLRSNFSDLVLEDALPALERLVEDLFKEFEMAHKRLYNVGSMDRGIIQHTGVSGLPSLQSVSEGSEYPIEEQVQGYDKTYSAVKYGGIVQITEELMEDEKLGFAKRRAEQLSRAMREAMQISAASVLNDNASGPDGVSLFNTAHPLSHPSAGTSSNRASADADLSLTAIQEGVTIMRKQVDNAGKKIQIRPKKIVVPSDLEFLAHELLESTSKPQAVDDGSTTEQNMVNAVRSRYGMGVEIMDFLTDIDSWFLLADPSDHEIHWFDRKSMSVSSDSEFRSDVALLKASARWAVGYSDWRGTFGSFGA
jgi:hypothetical protein